MNVVTPDSACPGLDPGIRGPDGSVQDGRCSYHIADADSVGLIGLAANAAGFFIALDAGSSPA